MRARGLHAEVDVSQREDLVQGAGALAHAKVPVILALGKREVERREVSMRRLGSREQRVLGLGEAVEMLAREVAIRGVTIDEADAA